MIVVPYPEAEDQDTLLSGPRGKLLGQMVAAMGLDESEVYLASAVPRYLPHADWAQLSVSGLDSVLARHIGLVAPARLIVFGQNILPLLGHDPTKTAETLHGFNHEGRSIPVLPAMDLGVLLDNPRRRASFWRHWLDWTGHNAT
jgi:uracil-DNA glycosylase